MFAKIKHAGRACRHKIVLLIKIIFLLTDMDQECSEDVREDVQVLFLSFYLVISRPFWFVDRVGPPLRHLSKGKLPQWPPLHRFSSVAPSILDFKRV